MIKNYFLITIRNLIKNRIFSIINIVGLSIGITCSILIILWITDEISYDKFHPKADRLYQLWGRAHYDNRVNSWTSVPLPSYEALKSANVHIQNTAVMDWGSDHLLTVGEKKLMKRGHNASGEFLTMFEFPLIFGNAASVLDDASSIVITQKTAKDLFGDEDPVNKMIRVDDKGDLKVSGILKDIPGNSTFDFDFLLPYKYWRSVVPWVVDNEDNWGNYSFQVFVELSDPLYLEEVQKSIKPMLIDHGQTEIKPEFFLYPLERWRLHGSFENGVEKGGMYDFVKMFGLIAIFILLIACINFMNLSTARSVGRAREVGIRKTMGSGRLDLIFQFISESMLITLVSFGIVVLLTQLLLPAYNSLVEKKLFIDYASPIFWLFSASIILLTGIISGSYPAFYLSSFQPVKVLKGKVLEGRRGSLPRKILVIMQFGFSILLITGTIVILKQIQLVKNRELGYDQDRLVVVERNEELNRNYEVLKNELLQTGIAEGVTLSNSPITDIHSNNFLGWPGKPEDQRILFTTITTSYDYTQTMGIRLLMGRDFSEDFISDSSAIIINKAALDLMNLEDPLGTQLDLWGDKRTLIGVIDNVLMGSPYQEVRPSFLVLADWGGYVTIRLRPNNDLNGSLNQVKRLFEKYNPAYPFEYTFADQDFDKKFKSINLTSNLVNLFAALAILITGLGLLGLSTYTAEQRTKEIGIRKVMGASVMNILSMMSYDFAKLVVISFIIAVPVTWWALRVYLDQYPIHVKLQPWIFAATGFFALSFAVFIVAAQSLRAAQTNPVNTLRDE
ncbi:MAG TPA: ABC transporter permease [Cyclobacteriaceae bacterium]|nr:ABC transporter permease [Cyclobacteriaceae bacterium]